MWPSCTWRHHVPVDPAVNRALHPAHIAIRELCPAEAERAAEIQVAPGTPWHRHGYRLPEARATIQSGLSSGARVLAADVNGLAGWIWFDKRGTFFHSGYIRILAVATEQQHAGVGSALLAAAEQEIFGVTPNIFLLVSETNESARGFYAKHGYCEVGRLDGYVRPGSIELICWKSIGPIGSEPPELHPLMNGE
jgi:ribosomal protein S18 acetylase RimI-like enzyme